MMIVMTMAQPRVTKPLDTAASRHYAAALSERKRGRSASIQGVRRGAAPAPFITDRLARTRIALPS
jgi:hypothetical protein